MSDPLHRLAALAQDAMGWVDDHRLYLDVDRCSFDELRDLVIRAQRHRIPYIIFPLWINGKKLKVLIKPLKCPPSLLDRRNRIDGFITWVFQTRVH